MSGSRSLCLWKEMGVWWARSDGTYSLGLACKRTTTNIINNNSSCCAVRNSRRLINSVSMGYYLIVNPNMSFTRGVECMPKEPTRNISFWLQHKNSNAPTSKKTKVQPSLGYLIKKNMTKNVSVLSVTRWRWPAYLVVKSTIIGIES